MNPEYQAKLEMWIREEIALLKAKGATAEDFEEEATLRLLAANLLARHPDEISAEKEVFQAITRVGFPTSEEWRRFAAEQRLAGKNDLAYQLERLADELDRQGW